MRIIADLHIHSRYSRATSPDMVLDHISQAAKLKGIDLVGTGDITHFLWVEELKSKLKPAGRGVYEYNGVNFILTGEVSCIYSHPSGVKKIHLLILLPSFESAEKLNNHLAQIGNIDSDGRPILGMSAEECLKIVMDTDADAMVIPAHIWTPWFSLLGANSGFNSMEECFGPLTKYIYAVETGLSSDPPMNWMVSWLDDYVLVSNSDAHSPENLGREVNIFDCDMDYYEITGALKNRDRTKFLGTIEFYPEEGKYHYDGHRACNVCGAPEEFKENNWRCPVCGKRLTVGVLHRVFDLADRNYGWEPEHPPYCRHLIPLREIIASARGVASKNSKQVQQDYRMLVAQFGSEFKVLTEIAIEELSRYNPRVAQGIADLREGKVHIQPGYDGVFGRISVFSPEAEPKQATLF